jgi:hypothetical protein
LTDDRRIDGMGDLLYLLSIGSPSARWRFLRHALAPGTEMMREQASSSSLSNLTWGYLSRFGRLTWQGARLILRLLRSGLEANR